MGELDRVLGIADEAEESKRLKQFQEWDANVHGVVQVQLIVRVASDLTHAIYCTLNATATIVVAHTSYNRIGLAEFLYRVSFI